MAEIVVATLKQLEIPYPTLDDKDRIALEAARKELEAERDKD